MVCYGSMQQLVCESDSVETCLLLLNLSDSVSPSGISPMY